MRRGKMMWMIMGLLIGCLVIAILVILPPGGGKMKPYLDEEGNILKGSVSEKLFLDCNGAKLGMFLTAKDETNPVLLFLGGGPGIPEYFLEQEYPTGLEDEFVVCYLEYRGTSLSYQPKMNPETITRQQYVEDAVAVTRYLMERFGQQKIYIMGHSFGTEIALHTVSQHPELYQAYVAMSQKTNQRESEYIAYDYMLEQYRLAGNKKRVQQFEACPVRASDEMYQKYKSSMLRDTAMHELGVGTARDMDSVMKDIFFASLRCKAYTPMERINIWRGKAFVQKTPIRNGDSSNAFAEVKKIEVPVYFFAGK